jgi:Fe2+ or Zn2+ uptake regulation protein
VAELKGAGLRVTSPRLAVLRSLHEAPHAETEAVIKRVRQQLGSVSNQAVYNVLAQLTEAGLVRRIQPASSPALYEARVGDNHHHVVCRSCGATSDVDCVVGRRPCLRPSDTADYEIDEAEIIFWGRCPRCRASAPAPAGPKPSRAGEKDRRSESPTVTTNETTKHRAKRGVSP